jgi:hypothetical protein
MEDRDTESAEWHVQDIPSHYVWEAASFIRLNPGAKGKDVTTHMEGVYPHDSHSTLGSVVGNWYMKEIAEKALYERRSKVEKARAGFYILAQGVLFTDLPKPTFKPRKPRPVLGAWASDPPEEGTMLMARAGGGIGYSIGPDGKLDHERYFHVSTASVCLFLGVISVKETTSDKILRCYGRSHIEGVVRVLADGQQMAMDASNLRFAVKKGRKNVSL